MARLLWVFAGVFAGIVAAKAADSETGKQPPGPETVAAWRARGPEGLVEALRIFDGLLVEQAQRTFSCAAPPMEEPKGEVRKLDAWRAAIDQIGGQRGCDVSRLYWYTDLAAAKAAAEQTGRPILSLRMLGKLTDEFSCANSRFFRTALYSNQEISDYLRDNFILHWQSVRPVPRVTIDFGDGRKLERTLTGNSAHYVLASDGTPLDVLPGLYGPQQFLQWLQATRGLETSYRRIDRSRPAPGPRWAQLLREYHAHRRDAILRDWDADLQRLGVKQLSLVSARISGAMEATNQAPQQMQRPAAPRANVAASQAVSKTFVEQPLLRFAGYGGPLLEKSMDDDLWKAIANLHRGDVHLDDNSLALMRKELPNANVAGALSATKRRVEDPMLRVVSTFEDSMALDAVRNEYRLHRRIHERLAESESGSMDFDALNEWVYAELFLTPRTDPWLGLAPADVYSALNHDGRAEPALQAGSPNGG